VNDEPEDYDSSGWLDRKTKKVQNESLGTSRRALEKLENAQGVAQSNLSKLAAQSEQLAGVEKRLQETDSHVRISEAKTDRLKALNRFFMLPAFGSKAAKRREDSLTKQLQAQKDEETAAGLRDMERRERLERIQAGSSMTGSSRGASLHPAAHAHSYSTPDGLERDDTEEEIDGNLNKISSGLSRLKMMGRSMNEELDAQKDQVSRIQDRTDSSKDRMNNLNRKMNSIANRR
jgi:hypothetical protein